MATAGVQSGARNHHDILFNSVFPPKQHTTATPQATPNIGTLASPGAAFGGFDLADDPATETRIFNQNWSVATAFLSLSPPGEREANLRVRDALETLLLSTESRKQLLEWYGHEISMHFRQFVLPKLQFWQNPIEVHQAGEALRSTVKVLTEDGHDLYFGNQIQALLGFELRNSAQRIEEPLHSFLADARSNLHVLTLHSLPRHRIQKTLTSYLFQEMQRSIESSDHSETCITQDTCICRVEFDTAFLHQLAGVGLGGAQGERAFAFAVHRFLQGPAIERRCFQVDWSEFGEEDGQGPNELYQKTGSLHYLRPRLKNWNGETRVTRRLRTWIQKLAASVSEAVQILSHKQFELCTAQFVSVAMISFGRNRTAALFDYVSTWPSSTNAVLDIKAYLHENGAAEKVHVCASFSEQIQRRLFHAGATTTELLTVYLNVYHVFQLLDPRGVLLEKVAIPIRNYLRGREDTVAIIAASFLACFGAVDEKVYSCVDRDKICLAVSEAIHDEDTNMKWNHEADEGPDELDLYWNNMQWMPDPIDAGPDYKSTKTDYNPIIAYIIGLFDPEDFIKAFSNALGQYLLKTEDRHYDMVIGVIEMLKERLDPSLLHNAEVMLKDMQVSATLNRRLNPSDVEIPSSVPPTPKELQSAIPDDGITLNSLYEQFKTRVDSTQFQASLQLVAKKRDDLYFPKRTRLPAERTKEIAKAEEAKNKINFETKVLSDHFWPQLRDGHFKVPHRIVEARERYEQAFSQRSAQRKLEWRPALDTTSIVLNLADRDVEANNVEVWKVTIIDAFATERHNADDIPPILQYDAEEGLSVANLAEALDMSEDYVQNGILFWLNKRVLYEKSSGMYAVLEHLDMDVPSIAEPSVLDIEDTGAVMSEQDMLKAHAGTFQTFIEQMLRNSGAKEIGGMMGITNVMKMVMPSFTFGDEEVKWLLEDMEGKGIVVRKGESWGVATGK